jgi:hypothetical protein
MARATFDLIDAAIPEDFERWQNYPDDARFRSYLRTFLTDPVYWSRHVPAEEAFGLNWQEYRYADVRTADELDAQITSNESGIYIFYVRPNRLICSFPRFAFYVGISNEHNSQRPLRDRLKDYLPSRVRAKAKRDNIDQMLQLYYGVLWVTYACTDLQSAQLMDLESKLHGFLFPCYARRDYPDDIKTQIKRFGIET